MSQKTVATTKVVQKIPAYAWVVTGIVAGPIAPISLAGGARNNGVAPTGGDWIGRRRSGTECGDVYRPGAVWMAFGDNELDNGRIPDDPDMPDRRHHRISRENQITEKRCTLARSNVQRSYVQRSFWAFTIPSVYVVLKPRPSNWGMMTVCASLPSTGW